MQITKDQQNDMYQYIQSICSQYGPRYSCSPAEKAANLWTQAQLAKFCDETHLEPFSTWPALYPQGLFLMLGLFCGTGWIWMFLPPPFSILTIVFVIVGFSILYLELYKLKRWIRPFFRKGESTNVFGVVKPRKEVKWRILIEGHSDSAKRMPNFEFKKGKAPLPKFILGLLYILVSIIMAIVKIAFWALDKSANGIHMIDLIYGISLILLFPWFIALLAGFVSNDVVMGANDNLSGGAVAYAVAKYFTQSEHRLDHVELWCGSVGSEENGSSGSQAFVASHGNILKNAYNLTLDTIGAGDTIMILAKDRMHGVGECKEITQRLDKAWEICKVEDPKMRPMIRGKLVFSSSDSCRFQHKGYLSTALICTNAGTGFNKPPNLHTPADVLENVDAGLLRQMLHIVLHFCENVDAEFKT